mmetsp:Transcript_147222/g.382721  ORF Transcript_147222/g.382721 Transcript_147222/m.382721 type:complete len:217 (+) Transcript_147222:279-929(+)
MGSTTTCCASSSTEASHRRVTTSSSATTSTAASRAWKPSRSCSATRSSTPRTFSFFAATMSAHRSHASTASTTSASGATTSSSGSSSATSSIACRSVASWTRRSFACTVVSRPRSTAWTRSGAWSAPPTCPTRASSAICCGRTQRRTSQVGQRTTAASRLSSVRMWCRASSRSRTWTWSVAPTRSSRTATSSSPNASSSPSSAHPTTAESSTTQVQ